MYDLGSSASGIISAINSLWIVLYFLQAWGLYMINIKLGEKHAWVSFVPVIQIYNYFTASRKPFLEYLVYPVLALIVGFVLSFFTFGISILIAYIYALVMWIKLLHAISIRTNKGVWTTVGFIFIPFIMFPVVGYKLGESNTTVVETSKEEKTEL
ncbi:MAG: hypothetical protein PHH06_04175 [Candidatus Gracilibacteria bacterium]|nr:hypothetical protein [Candidatus Gracilibacteria bacterium]